MILLAYLATPSVPLVAKGIRKSVALERCCCDREISTKRGFTVISAEKLVSGMQTYWYSYV